MVRWLLGGIRQWGQRGDERRRRRVVFGGRLKGRIVFGSCGRWVESWLWEKGWVDFLVEIIFSLMEIDDFGLRIGWERFCCGLGIKSRPVLHTPS